MLYVYQAYVSLYQAYAGVCQAGADLLELVSKAGWLTAL